MADLEQEANLTAVELIRLTAAGEPEKNRLTASLFASYAVRAEQAGAGTTEAVGALIGALATLAAASVKVATALETGLPPAQVTAAQVADRLDIMEHAFLLRGGASPT